MTWGKARFIKTVHKTQWQETSSLKLKASIHQKATISEKQATGRKGIHIYNQQSFFNKYFIKDDI